MKTDKSFYSNQTKGRGNNRGGYNNRGFRGRGRGTK
jgi:hypothetical protein